MLLFVAAVNPPCSIISVVLLRLLRPILLATEANAEVIEQLFEVTGEFSIHLKDHDTVIGKNMMKSDYNLRISLEAAVGSCIVVYPILWCTSMATHNP